MKNKPTNLFFKKMMFEMMVGKQQKGKEKGLCVVRGAKAWVELCWPLGLIPRSTGKHLAAAESEFVGKSILNFCVSRIVRNSYFPVGKIKPFSSKSEKLTEVARDATKRAVRHCQPPESLQWWGSVGEGTQLSLRKCMVLSVIREGRKILMASAALSLGERRCWCQGGDCFSHGGVSKAAARQPRA